MTGSSRSGKNPGGGGGPEALLEFAFPGAFVSKLRSSSSSVMALPGGGGRSILARVSGSGLVFKTGSNLPIPASRDKK